MKSLVRQVSRAAGIDNRHDLVVRKWSPRKVMDSYLGVRHFFAFTWFSSDKKRLYEKNITEEILQCNIKTKGETIWGAVMECLELLGLVWYFNNIECKFIYILSFF